MRGGQSAQKCRGLRHFRGGVACAKVAPQFNRGWVMADLAAARELFMQAQAAQEAGDLAGAERALRAALGHAPGRESILVNLAGVLIALNNFAEALPLCEAVLAANPQQPQAWLNRSLCELDAGADEAALASVMQARQIAPHDAGVLGALGAALFRLQRYAEALAAYEAACRAEPAVPGWHTMRGVALRALGRLEEAAAAHAQALRIDPEFGEARWNAALVDLALGQYVAGWAGFEWRWRTEREALTPAYRGSAPRWQGEAPAGRRILLWAEQGLGDTLQFCRFAQMLQGRGAHVLLQVQPTLVELLRTLDPAITVVAKGEALPAHDLHAPLLSVPHLLRLDTLPAAPAYLHAPARPAAAWAEEAGTRPRIGVMWAGNCENPRGRYRSMPLAAMQRVFALPADFVCLGRDISPDEREQLRAIPNVREYADVLATMADTAALISTLDYVLSIDTSVAHLAASLGKPTWLLLAQNADWRWGRADSVSPWYPHSTRLFRQRKAGEWHGVVADAVQALRQAIAG